MKKSFITTVLVIAAILAAISQENYQTFPSAGFKVKCECTLRTNSLFIQMASQQGNNDIVGAYICAENENDPSTGCIININIYDESKRYKNIKSSYHEYFTKKILEKYASNLSQAGFSYSFISFQGESALEYTFDQNGVPTKALFFYKNQRSYLLQVASRNGLTQKYNSIKNSFQIL